MHGMGRAIVAAFAITILALAQPALAADCSRASVGHDALPDLASGTYKGERGGLYVGTNEPPAAYAEAGRRAASQIVPLDASGVPSAGGKIVLLSIGMSNTTQEFSTFVAVASSDAVRAPAVVVVDGAQGGQDARVWARADAETWAVVDQRLRAGGVTAQQVQAIWLKQAVAGPRGDFATSTLALIDLLDAIVRNAAQRYPNLRQVFLSPRTYAGYATTTLNPEPYAFETAFADRALIMRSVAAPDARPWLGWGPYLWTDGTRGGPDGFTWTCEDVAQDGTHPSRSGQQKVAQLLQTFFDTSPFTTWYRGEVIAAATRQPAPASAAPFAIASVPPGASMAAASGVDDAAAARTVLVIGLALAALLVSSLFLARRRGA